MASFIQQTSCFFGGVGVGSSLRVSRRRSSVWWPWEKQCTETHSTVNIHMQPYSPEVMEYCNRFFLVSVCVLYVCFCVWVSVVVMDKQPHLLLLMLQWGMAWWQTHCRLCVHACAVSHEQMHVHIFCSCSHCVNDYTHSTFFNFIFFACVLACVFMPVPVLVYRRALNWPGISHRHPPLCSAAGSLGDSQTSIPHPGSTTTTHRPHLHPSFTTTPTKHSSYPIKWENNAVGRNSP